MPALLETRIMVARRVREIAAGLTNPADIKAAEAYARELEQEVLKQRTSFMADNQRDS